MEHLEWEESYCEPHPLGEEVGGANQIHRQLKEDILRLLLLCATSSSFNIGSLLLGFVQLNDNRRRKVSETILQDPGITSYLYLYVVTFYV